MVYSNYAFKKKNLRSRVAAFHVQWNLSIVDTTGPRKFALIREVSLFQSLICMGPLIREVFLFQGMVCAQKYAIGTSETVLIREVSLFQRFPLRNIPLYMCIHMYMYTYIHTYIMHTYVHVCTYVRMYRIVSNSRRVV